MKTMKTSYKQETEKITTRKEQTIRIRHKYTQHSHFTYTIHHRSIVCKTEGNIYISCNSVLCFNFWGKTVNANCEEKNAANITSVEKWWFFLAFLPHFFIAFGWHEFNSSVFIMSWIYSVYSVHIKWNCLWTHFKWCGK